MLVPAAAAATALRYFLLQIPALRHVDYGDAASR
jgi:hypothetical protein